MDRRDSWSVSKFDIKQSLCEAQRQQLVSLGIKILGVVSLIVILVLYFSSLKPRPAFDTSKIPHYLYHSTGVTLFGGKVTLAKEGLLNPAGNEKVLEGLQKRLAEQGPGDAALDNTALLAEPGATQPTQKVKVVQEGGNWKLIRPISTKDALLSHEQNRWSFVVDVREGVKFPVLKNQVMLSVDLDGMEQSVPEVKVFIRREGEKEVKAPLPEELQIQPQGKQGQAYVYKILLDKILFPGEQIALQVSWEGSAQAVPVPPSPVS